MKIAIADVKFDAVGLVPVVEQDARTRRVLTLAYMNAESLARTLETNETWFWSRSRSCLWHKGETSGNTQRVVDVLLDCDGDALNVFVVPSTRWLNRESVKDPKALTRLIFSIRASTRFSRRLARNRRRRSSPRRTTIWRAS